MIVCVSSSRHPQRNGEVISQARGRALAVQAVDDQLRLDDFHWHRRCCRCPLRCGLDLRSAHTHTRHRDVRITLPRRNRYRRRRLAHILGHAAQAHRHRVRATADHSIDQPLYVKLVVIAVQALAQNQLASTVTYKPETEFFTHIHIDHFGDKPRRGNVHRRFPHLQGVDRDRHSGIDLPLWNEHFCWGGGGNGGIPAANGGLHAALRCCLVQEHTNGACQLFAHHKIRGGICVEADGIDAQHRCCSLVTRCRRREICGPQALALDNEGCLALPCRYLHGSRDLG